MGMFSHLFGKKRPLVGDAKRLYATLMAQSRKAEFFGESRMPDTYEGRIELLTLHMAVVMYALRNHGENGEKLSQAVFDVMVDDFDSALRGEGLTDSGVKRRIKPIVELFYARLKSYTEGLNEGEVLPALTSGELKDANSATFSEFAAYTLDLSHVLSDLSLGAIALAEFSFPNLTKA